MFLQSSTNFGEPVLSCLRFLRFVADMSGTQCPSVSQFLQREVIGVTVTFLSARTTLTKYTRYTQQNFAIEIDKCDREVLFRAVAFEENSFVLQIALDLSRNSTKAGNYDSGQGGLAV